MTDVYSTNARWFNGRDPRPRMALVRIHGQHLELVPHSSESSAGWPRGVAGDDAAFEWQGSSRRYARKLLKVGERWRGTPVPVQLPDGGTVLLSADSAVAKALASQGLATRLMGSWTGVAASLALLLTLLIGASVLVNAYGRTAWDAWLGVFAAAEAALPAPAAAAAPAEPAGFATGSPAAFGLNSPITSRLPRSRYGTG
ncbi:DUF7092 domain-containing protein [Roseateles terrae]|uniref:DUF7092 domain-containing protein n=1 Tax=Roseateles terrae TaxID=431060 RepID=A0ABR6H004_9BURK|nr:hypothetical protein [Roseateles terrae]